MTAQDLVARRQQMRAEPTHQLIRNDDKDMFADEKPRVERTPPTVAASGADGLVEREEIVLSDNSKYKGQWRGDKKEGKGTLHYADGAVYTGKSSDLRRRVQK